MDQLESVQTGQSGKIAKERLQQMKLSEVTDCSAEELEEMKDELTCVIRKYMNLGKQELRLYFRHGIPAGILIAVFVG